MSHVRDSVRVGEISRCIAKWVLRHCRTVANSGHAPTTNRRCERCGASVSNRFVRVFGYDDAVYGCLDCLTRTELAVGKAALRPDERDHYVRWGAAGDS